MPELPADYRPGYNKLGIRAVSKLIVITDMSAILQFSSDDEAKALPILLRHSPGTVLANRTYVVEDAVVNELRNAGVAFQEVAPTLNLSFAEDNPIGERI